VFLSGRLFDIFGQGQEQTFTVEHLKWSFTRAGSVLTLKHKTRVERPAINKHSGLLVTSIAVKSFITLVRGLSLAKLSGFFLRNKKRLLLLLLLLFLLLLSLPLLLLYRKVTSYVLAQAP
jgi:hypothetical protein